MISAAFCRLVRVWLFCWRWPSPPALRARRRPRGCRALLRAGTAAAVRRVGERAVPRRKVGRKFPAERGCAARGSRGRGTAFPFCLFGLVLYYTRLWFLLLLLILFFFFLPFLFILLYFIFSSPLFACPFGTARAVRADSNVPLTRRPPAPQRAAPAPRTPLLLPLSPSLSAGERNGPGAAPSAQHRAFCPLAPLGRGGFRALWRGHGV